MPYTTYPALGYFRAERICSLLLRTISDSCQPKRRCWWEQRRWDAALRPRIATRFHTGLTADCTKLELRENTDLVQIRPAFGGNIMAQIVTPNTRPQFATVRYKVMDAPIREAAAAGNVLARRLPAGVKASRCKPCERLSRIQPTQNDLAMRTILVVGGRGRRKESRTDLRLLQELAELLGGGLGGHAPRWLRSRMGRE